MVVADSQPGHIDQIKQTNAGAVYRLIDQLGPVSRIDLSRLAQLAPAGFLVERHDLTLYGCCQDCARPVRGKRVAVAG